MVKQDKEKRVGIIIEVSPELVAIFEKIKKSVEEYTWGAEKNLSNLSASKILAAKVKRAGLY